MSLHLRVRITGVSGGSVPQLETLAPWGTGGYTPAAGRLLWPDAAYLAYIHKRKLLSPVFPITLQELKIHFEEGFKHFFPSNLSTLIHCGLQRDDLDFLAHSQIKLYQSQLGHLLAAPAAQDCKISSPM